MSSSRRLRGEMFAELVHEGFKMTIAEGAKSFMCLAGLVNKEFRHPCVDRALASVGTEPKTQPQAKTSIWLLELRGLPPFISLRSLVEFM